VWRGAFASIEARCTRANYTQAVHFARGILKKEKEKH
jgi:hypothetical protein